MKNLKQFLALAFSIMLLFACTSGEDDETITIIEVDIDNLKLSDIYGTWNVTHLYDEELNEAVAINTPYDYYEKDWTYNEETGEETSVIICPNKPYSLDNHEYIKLGYTSTNSYYKERFTETMYNYDTPLYNEETGEYNCDATGKTLGDTVVYDDDQDKYTVEEYIISGNSIYYLEVYEYDEVYTYYEAYRLSFQDNGEVLFAYSDEYYDNEIDITNLDLTSLTYYKAAKIQKESTEITFEIDTTTNNNSKIYKTTESKQSKKTFKRLLIK